MRSKPTAGTARTQRMRKASCEGCGYIAYISRRWIAQGLPTCPCGGRLIPEDPDDAALILSPDELAQHPAVIEYDRAIASVLQGQKGTTGVSRNAGNPHELAAKKVERARRERARAAQLAAIAPKPATGLPF